MGNCLEPLDKNCFICNEIIKQPKYLHCKKCRINYHFVCLLHANNAVECCVKCRKKLVTIKDRNSFVYTNNNTLSFSSKELNNCKSDSNLTFTNSSSYKSIRSSKTNDNY